VLLTGPAGSGKTTALCARARELRQRDPDQRILVLCTTGALASYLRRTLPADPRMDVATFHDWALARLAGSGLVVPKPPGRGTAWDRYWTHDMARLLLKALRDGHVPAPVYRAALIDEGQDFVPDWCHAIARSVDPDGGELVVAVDPAQDVYGRAVSWQDLGFTPSDPVPALTVNHRNSPAIAAAAARLIGMTESTGRDAEPEDGLAPDVRRCESFEASRLHALAWVRDRLAAGALASNLLVLGLSRLDMITVNAWLNSKGVPAWLPMEREADSGVRVSTIHAAKGLEAESVLLLDAHHLQTREPEDGRRLLYIAMTRARRDLTVSYFRDVPLMTELERACRPG
jgi:superfamily I DNA/RNA helicase